MTVVRKDGRQLGGSLSIEQVKGYPFAKLAIDTLRKEFGDEVQRRCVDALEKGYSEAVTEYEDINKKLTGLFEASDEEINLGMTPKVKSLILNCVLTGIETFKDAVSRFNYSIIELESKYGTIGQKFAAPMHAHEGVYINQLWTFAFQCVGYNRQEAMTHSLAKLLESLASPADGQEAWVPRPEEIAKVLEETPQEFFYTDKKEQEKVKPEPALFQQPKAEEKPQLKAPRAKQPNTGNPKAVPKQTVDVFFPYSLQPILEKEGIHSYHEFFEWIAVAEINEELKAGVSLSQFRREILPMAKLYQARPFIVRHAGLEVFKGYFSTIDLVEKDTACMAFDEIVNCFRFIPEYNQFSSGLNPLGVVELLKVYEGFLTEIEQFKNFRFDLRGLINLGLDDFREAVKAFVASILFVAEKSGKVSRKKNDRVWLNIAALTSIVQTIVQILFVDESGKTLLEKKIELKNSGISEKLMQTAFDAVSKIFSPEELILQFPEDEGPQNPANSANQPSAEKRNPVTTERKNSMTSTTATPATTTAPAFTGSVEDIMKALESKVSTMTFDSHVKKVDENFAKIDKRVGELELKVAGHSRDIRDLRSRMETLERGRSGGDHVTDVVEKMRQRKEELQLKKIEREIKATEESDDKWLTAENVAYTAGGAAVVGAAGYGIYKLFFDNNSGV